MTRHERHVVPNPAGGWDVVAPEGERPSAHRDTQVDAIDRAREIVHNAGGGEVVIHDRHGRIRDSTPSHPGTTPTLPVTRSSGR